MPLLAHLSAGPPGSHGRRHAGRAYPWEVGTSRPVASRTESQPGTQRGGRPTHPRFRLECRRAPAPERRGFGTTPTSSRGGRASSTISIIICIAALDPVRVPARHVVVVRLCHLLRDEAFMSSQQAGTWANLRKKADPSPPPAEAGQGSRAEPSPRG